MRQYWLEHPIHVLGTFYINRLENTGKVEKMFVPKRIRFMYCTTLNREGTWYWTVNAEFQFVASGLHYVICTVTWCTVTHACHLYNLNNRSKPATRCLFLKVHAVLWMACLFYRHKEKGPGGQATREPNGRMGPVYTVYMTGDIRFCFCSIC